MPPDLQRGIALLNGWVTRLFRKTLLRYRSAVVMDCSIKLHHPPIERFMAGMKAKRYGDPVSWLRPYTGFLVGPFGAKPPLDLSRPAKRITRSVLPRAQLRHPLSPCAIRIYPFLKESSVEGPKGEPRLACPPQKRTFVGSKESVPKPALPPPLEPQKTQEGACVSQLNITPPQGNWSRNDTKGG